MTSLTPRWRTTPHRGRLLTIAIVTVVLAYAVGRPELIVLAAPLLVLAAATRRPPCRIDVTASIDSPRCFEDDEVALTVRVQLSERVEQVSTGIRRTATMATAPYGAQVAARAAVATFRWTVTPARWGRYRLGPLPVRVVAPGAAVAATLQVTGPELTVYPRPMHAGAVPLPTTLPRRPGDHPARVAGTGMEFVGVRPTRQATGSGT